MTTVFTAMQPTHLDAVWRIECAAHSHPWAESLVRDLTSRGACHQVMLVDQQVVGYLCPEYCWRSDLIEYCG